MLKELITLVLLVEKNYPNCEETLVHLSKGDRHVIKLFHTLQNNAFKTELEAIGKVKIGERTKFRQASKKLLRCLEQMVLIMEYEKKMLDDLSHNRFRGHQLIALNHNISILGNRINTKKISEDLIKIGIEYNQPTFIVEAAKMMMEYVATFVLDIQVFNYYLSIFEENKKWVTLEENMSIFANDIRISLAKKRTPDPKIASKIDLFLKDVEKYKGKIPSHSFHVTYYYLNHIKHVLSSDYRGASNVHLEAINYFENVKYSCGITKHLFHYMEIANCVYLGEYERGRYFLNKSLEYAGPGNVNWFNTYELGFYLCMHEGDWVGAAQLYSTAIKHKQFIVLRDVQRETWLILGAYLYIVLQLTGTQIQEGLVPKFSSTRFRNDVKDFVHDKTGMNVAILIAEALLDFVCSKKRDLWDRIAALEKYRERYLRTGGKDTHRSQLFIKILTIFAKYSHEGTKFLQKAEPHLEELRKAPLQLVNQAHELEIVPYEKLIQLLAQTAGVCWTANPVEKG